MCDTHTHIVSEGNKIQAVFGILVGDEEEDDLQVPDCRNRLKSGWCFF
jgi:hypothetical protein